MSEERMQILQMVSEGTITAEQAAQLIQALDESVEPVEADDAAVNYLEEVGTSDAVEVFDPREPTEPSGGPRETAQPGGSAGDESHTASPPPAADFNKWRRFWYLPLAAGVLITTVSGLLVYAGSQGSWHWFWMSCVWLPLVAGIFIILFSWMSRTARWLHVRVNTGQDEWPRRIAISLPLPLRASAFLMGTFGRFIPGLDDVPVPIDEAIRALETSLTPEDPLYVHVEDSDGERVEVYIG